MTRLCERPGCSAPASCAYGIDPGRLLVWIDSLGSDVAPGVGARVGALCRRHADAMVVPRDWQLDDRRAAGAAIPAHYSASEGQASAPPAVPAAAADDAASPPAERAADRSPARGIVRRRLAPARHLEGPQPEQLVLIDLDSAPPGDSTRDASAADSDGTAPAERADAASADRADVVDDAEPGPAAEPAAHTGPAADSVPSAATAPDAAADPTVTTDDLPAGADETPVAPWRPVFDQTDDLGGVLTARSPLLARAFGRRGGSGAHAPARAPAPADAEGRRSTRHPRETDT